MQPPVGEEDAMAIGILVGYQRLLLNHFVGQLDEMKLGYFLDSALIGV